MKSKEEITMANTDTKKNNNEVKKETKKNVTESVIDALWNRNRRMNCKG